MSIPVKKILAQNCRVGMVVVGGTKELPEFFKIQEIHINPPANEGEIRLDGVIITFRLTDNHLVRVVNGDPAA